MFTLTFVTVALILTIIAIVVSEICLSIENHDLTDQLNEQIHTNKYLADWITEQNQSAPKHLDSTPTVTLPTQE